VSKIKERQKVLGLVNNGK